jgi:chaperone required for assembly of F1-ATPase
MTGWSKKRTWEIAYANKTDSGFEIFLDEKKVSTPKNHILLLPTEKLALEIVREWDEQLDNVEYSKMPFNRLANSSIDKVKTNFDSIVLDLAGYGDTDVVCYRAETPAELVLRQQKHWDPVLKWAKTELGISLRPIVGIKYHPQDPGALKKIFDKINSFDHFSLTALYDLITISGSVLLALATSNEHMRPEIAWEKSVLDENWQREKWGNDDESILDRTNKLADFKMAYEFLKLLD